MKISNDADSIELKGNLLLIYKRNSQNMALIDNLNLVFKGYWKEKFSNNSHDFIYKKNWAIPQVQP